MDYFAILGKALVGLPRALLLLWPLWLMLGLMYAAKLVFQWFERQRLSASGIGEIDRMDGKTFEKYLETLFARLGYAVERTRYIGDFGADLVARKDGVKTVIQAKRYKGRVGVKAVQEAVAAKGYYDCQAAMVVTNSFFTQQAVKLAQANEVTLWNRQRLVQALLAVRQAGVTTPDIVPTDRSEPGAGTAEPLAVPTESCRARCASCGKAVSEKVLEYCLARPAEFDGEVYCYEHQKARRRGQLVGR